MKTSLRIWSGLACGMVGATAVAVALAQPPRQGGREGLDGRERREGPGGRFGGGPGVPPLLVLQALDRDNDGVISSKEIDNASASLRSLDRDGNGSLDRDEFIGDFGRFGRGPGGPGGPGGPDPTELVERMLSFDKNGDGKLSVEELPERMKALLERADANKDGLIDRDELTQQATRQMRGAGGGRGGFGPPRGPEGGRPEGQDRRPD